MAGKFARSWGLMKASAAVLRSDKALLAFPLLSGLCSLVVAASFLLPVALAVIASDGHTLDHDRWSPATWLLMFAFYLVQYFVFLHGRTTVSPLASSSLPATIAITTCGGLYELSGNDAGPQAADSGRLRRGRPYPVLIAEGWNLSRIGQPICARTCAL